MDKYDKKFINSAIQWSEYSYCKRKQVGAVLVKDGREIASGYNGTISGSGSNNCEDTYYKCPDCKITAKNWEKIFSINMEYRDIYDPLMETYTVLCKSCKYIIYSAKSMEDIDKKLKHSVTKDSVIHAERNIIAYCAKHGISTDDCTMYITHSPCQGCAVLMAQSGINHKSQAPNIK